MRAEEDSQIFTGPRSAANGGEKRREEDTEVTAASSTRETPLALLLLKPFTAVVLSCTLGRCGIK